MGVSLTKKTSDYRNQQRVLDHISTPLKITTVDITFDSSYPSGGEILNATDLDIGATRIIAVIPDGASRGNSYGYVLGPKYSTDESNAKLRVFEVDADYAGDRALKEVANGTDLSAVTFRCLVLAY